MQVVAYVRTVFELYNSATMVYSQSSKIESFSTYRHIELINIVYLILNWIQSAMKYSKITTNWRRFSLLSFSALFLTGTGLAQFTGIETEVHATSAFGTTYHIYANFAEPTDECIALYSIGTAEVGSVDLSIDVTTSFYQHPAGSNLGSGISEFFITLVPELAFDSWLTIGSDNSNDGPVSSIGMSDAFGLFSAGGGFVLNGETGGSWYVTPASNPAALAGEDGRVLLAQLTAADDAEGNAGHVVCDWNLQWRNANGVSENVIGLFVDTSDAPVDLAGCMDATACNYDVAATTDDGSCSTLDECGVCGGAGIADGTCDCEGSLPDAGYDCDGVCLSDVDGDGVCDENEMNGCTDEMACNYEVAATEDDDSCTYAGSGYNCAGECLVDTDGDGVCDANEQEGCTDSTACNYTETATEDDASCTYAAEHYDCAGNCLVDTDDDGVCDANEILGCTVESASNYSEEATDDDASCLYATTLNVDMSCAGIAFSTVHVTGPFCSWCGSEGWNDLSDTDGDMIYSVTLDLAAGDAEYKYMVDNWAGQEDLVDDMAGGASCAPVTDYASYANRLVVAGSTTNDTYGSCTSCAEQLSYATVSFEIDMNNVEYSTSDYDNVVINGSWNGWNGWGVTLSDDNADGIFTGSAEFIQNSSFEFVVAVTGPADGWSGWGITFNAPAACSTNPEAPIGEGGGNYGADVLESDLTIAYCTGSCDAVCIPIVSGCTDVSACNYDENATDDDGSCAELDACDVCGGNGIAEGACDCDGNVVDVLGVCGGTCLADDNNNGTCDADDVDGCMSSNALNYNPAATWDDGTCIIPEFPFITVEQHSVSDFGVTYRVYAQFENAGEECVAIYSVGSSEMNPVSLSLGVSTQFYQHPAGSDLGSGISPFFLNFDPTLNYDSWLTIGSETTEDGPVSSIGLFDAFAAFDAGNGFTVDGETGGSWYVTPGSNPGAIAGEDGRVLLAQLTVEDGAEGGFLDGNWNMQWRNESGESTNSTGLTFTSAEYVPEVLGCMDATACNFDAEANTDDASCLFIDECGICGGDGIAENACDCEGNMPTEGYDCNEVCLLDSDGDGVCDAFEISGCTDSEACNYSSEATDDDGSCASFDECGVCGGEGIALGTCDCEGNAPESGYDCDGICSADSDEDGVCDSFEIPGCQDPLACNFNSAATDDDASCTYAEFGQDCTGDCISDFDGDGICNSSEVAGCTSTSANNYNASATDDDGSCMWDDGLFTGLTYELVGHDLIEGSSTYRLFANFNPSETIQVTACYGTSEDNWSISSTEPFHQDPNGALLAHSINPSYYAFFPELEFDSWLALGGAPGAPIELQTIGLEAFFSDFETSGANVLVDTPVGASLYYIPGNMASTLSNPVDGKMLLGQFTTSGVVSVQCNLQFRDAEQATHYATDLNIVFPTFGVGCTDSDACNYDIEATDDDGTCYYDSEFRDCAGVCLADADGDDVCDGEEIAGCMDSTAYNYSSEATDEDGNCMYAGCFDELACNYTPEADVDVPSTCIYPGAYMDCDGNCNGDYEGDGVEECAEISGCASESATNYDPVATNDDGSCVWGDETFLGLSYELIGENTIETDATYRLYANFNPEASVDMTSLFGNSENPWLTLSTGDFYQHPLGADFGGNINPGFFGFFPELEFDSWLTIGAGPGDYNAMAQENMYLYLDTFNAGDDLIIDSEAGAQIFLNDGASDTQGVPDENGQLLLGQFTTSGVVFLRYNIRFQDAAGTVHEFTDLELTFPPIAGGCTDPLASNYDETANFEDLTCIYDGCTDPDADNFNPSSNLNDGSCLYTGCYDAEADNYDAQANTGDQDALCEYFGCMDATADNYDAGANVEDGSCLYTGCMDAAADNYDAQANTGDQEALCEYFGCTDSIADNYDAQANVEDGSCLYTGCMDAAADNYNAQANTGEQDAICLYTGCMDAAADNYDAQANTGDQDAICLYTGCMDALASNYDAQANTGDQEALCEYNGCTNPIADNFNMGANVDDGSCIVAGCMYDAALNYNPDATYDNMTCEFAVQGCTDPAASNYNETAGVENDSCLYAGCTNAGADNYTAEASIDDGSCIYSGCTDPLACNFNAAATNEDGSCLIVGCMDPDGLNYDESANFPGGCDYPDACPGDINSDGFVDVSDLLTFFQYYGTACSE